MKNKLFTLFTFFTKNVVILSLTLPAVFWEIRLLATGNEAVTGKEAPGNKTIKIRADVWCPYNCDVGAKNPGLFIEIAQMALEPKGFKIDYQIMNWARSIEETRGGSIDAIVGAAHSDAPDLNFPTQPQAQALFSFFVLKESNMSFVDIFSFKESGLGVISGYAYDDKTNETVKTSPPWITLSSGDEGLGQLIKMLKAKRIGGLIENPGVFYTFLENNRISRNEFKVIGSPKMKPQELFIAFSPKRKDVQQLTTFVDDAMKKMKADGTYKKLLKKYNL